MDTMIWTNCWTSPEKLECLQKAVGMDNLEGHIETLPLAITITNSFRQHPKIDDENEEIREWLKKYKLRKYYNKFIEHGYDDLDQLLDLSPEKLEHFQKAVGMDTIWKDTLKGCIQQQQLKIQYGITHCQ